MIPPSIGRVVWFTPSVVGDPRFDVKQPCAALITYVWSDRLVNIVAFDQNGNAQGHSSVQLLQDDDAKPEGGYFASWMPYQIGQAKKAEKSDA